MSKPPVTVDAFSIAKEALRLVGEFGTPPTPEVYEVWYRYAEGGNEEMRDQLAHAVNDAKSVSVELLSSLHRQFCTMIDPTSMNVGQSLAAELGKLHRLVVNQKDAGNHFGDSIEAANRFLTTDAKSQDELIACVANLIDGTSKMQRRLEDMNSQLEDAERQVTILQSDLEASHRGMLTDHLTGIGNRRFFDSVIKQMIATSQEDGLVPFLVLLDVDRFKAINDTFGHDAGDQLIRFVAGQIAQLRPEASLSRLGGDEFAMFLRASEREEVVQLTTEIKEHFARQKLRLRESKELVGAITFSFGASKLRPSDDPISWYQRADKLLYEAKNLGRDRAVVEKSRG